MIEFLGATNMVTDHQTPDTRHIEAIRKGDLISLLELHKKNELLPTGIVSISDISRRDIIEYAYARLMAYTVDRIAVQILRYGSLGDSLETLQKIITDVIHDIDTSPDGLKFLPKQRALLEKATSVLLSDITDFKSQLPEKNKDQFVHAHLGSRFSHLSSHAYTFDTQTYPGAVVIRIVNKDDYFKVTSRESQGSYIKTLGEGLLKGRILVVRAKTPPDTLTEYHEYLHFLNSKLRHLEIFPGSERNVESKIKTATLRFERILHDLQKEKDLIKEKKYRELQLLGKVSAVRKQELSDIQEEIRKYQQTQDTVIYLTEVEVSTYSDPDVKKAFNKVRDELQSYLVGDNALPRKFIANTLGIGFSDSLSRTTQGQLFLNELGVLKKILTLAINTDLDPQELGFLVSGARNLTMAIKFVYLHLSQAPKRF